MPRKSCVPLLLLLVLGTPPSVAAETAAASLDSREVRLADLVQLTRGGENAEAYWSPDGRQLVFQSTRPPYACDQIFRMPADGSGEPALVSTGKGRTTCSYFTADGERILYASTHLAGDACPPPADRSQGYVWPVNPNYEIFSVRPDGSDPIRQTDNRAYDAEATVCPKDGSVIFTSTRDGDLDLYRMDADGGNVRRLTREPGYDGGAFFSPDCTKIVWRASRPAPGQELEDYRSLLARDLVRPTRLEIFVANADGSEARQVTRLGAASFAPAFFPSGDRIIFSSNYGDPKGREFDLWAVGVDGSGLERITWTPGFDGFPLFSPDGTRLAFASNRNPGAPGETNVFVARWKESEAAALYLADVAWLADPAREGRGIGTDGLAAARDWLAGRFRESGMEPAGEQGGWFQTFEVPAGIKVRESAASIDGRPVDPEEFQPSGASISGKAVGEVVAAGYGIVAPEHGVDDYKGIDVRGKIVAVRRFAPLKEPFDDPAVLGQYGDVLYKARTAQERGAIGMIVVDVAPPGEPALAEAPLPNLASESAGEPSGIPVILATRAAGAALFDGGHKASLSVDLDRRGSPGSNVIGVIRAGAANRLPGAVVIGGHYDHLGYGGRGAADPWNREVHNGADDNASGTAALIEVARRLSSRRGELRRDVYFAAFAGEEIGLLGSRLFTEKPPAGVSMKDVMAMINLDMVGRLRDGLVTVMGGDSAAEWKQLVGPICRQADLRCNIGGSGFGSSDHSPFYGAGVPVLYFFTGIHPDYHMASDDVEKINAEGAVRLSGVVAETALTVANRPEPLTYTEPPPRPAPAASSGGALNGEAAAARFLEDVSWLADDAREGRGLGTQGLTAARDWLVARFREIGAEPAGADGGWFQEISVPATLAVLPGTAVAVNGKPLDRKDFQPAGFSASGELGRAEGEVVVAGYGIAAPELGVDDYKGVDVRGKLVAVRRFTPKGAPFDQAEVERRYSDLRAKAFTARERGASGLIVVDAPPPGAEETAEAPLPEPAIDAGGVAAAGDAGLPVVFLSRAAGAPLFSGENRASLALEIETKSVPASNVIGMIRAGAPDRLPGAVVVGAHYDHLGRGEKGSLEPDKKEVHNGADDNASGTAALLEVGRRLASRRGELRRDVYLAAFSAEEVGAIGSTAFTRNPPAGLRMEEVAGMLNMDMVGRLRNRQLAVMGGDSAAEWKDLVGPICKQAELACTIEGDGYGSSDHAPFYAAGVPVLHFFTGTHGDYHKTTDDADKIEIAGSVQVAGVVADVALGLAGRPGRLAYKSTPAPGPKGDPRSPGASLGTVPDYAGDGRPGVLLAGVRPGSPAEKGGLQRGDLLVELAGSPIRNIHDLMYVLRRAKAGETAAAVVERGGQRVEVQVTFEASRGMR